MAANLLVPFIRRAHVQACIEHDLSLVVLHGGMHSRCGYVACGGSRVCLCSSPSAPPGPRAERWPTERTVSWYKGSEAGGHLLGIEPLQDALPQVLGVAEGTIPAEDALARLTPG